MIIVPSAIAGKKYISSVANTLSVTFPSATTIRGMVLSSDASKCYVLSNKLELVEINTSSLAISSSRGGWGSNLNLIWSILSQDGTKIFSCTGGGEYAYSQIYATTISTGATSFVANADASWYGYPTYNSDKSRIYATQLQGPTGWYGGGGYTIWNANTGEKIKAAYPGGFSYGSDQGCVIGSNKVFCSDTAGWVITNYSDDSYITRLAVSQTSSIYDAKMRPNSTHFHFTSYGNSPYYGNGWGIINTATNSLVSFQSFPGGRAQDGWAFSPDGKYMYGCNGTNIQVIDVDTLTSIAQINLNSRNMVITPDGSKIFTGLYGNTVSVLS